MKQGLGYMLMLIRSKSGCSSASLRLISVSAFLEVAEKIVGVCGAGWVPRDKYI